MRLRATHRPYRGMCDGGVYIKICSIFFIKGIDIGKYLWYYIDTGKENKPNEIYKEDGTMMNRESTNKMMAEIASMRMLKAEAEAELKKLEDELKAIMEAEGIEELVGDEHKVTWKSVTSSRFDSTAFKKAGHEDLYKEFSKPSTSMRFTFA